MTEHKQNMRIAILLGITATVFVLGGVLKILGYL